SDADCTHCRAKSSKPGAISVKQLFQSSWLAKFCMTSSRSLSSRRRQGLILSSPTEFFLVVACPVADARAAGIAFERGTDSLIRLKSLTPNWLAKRKLREA